MTTVHNPDPKPLRDIRRAVESWKAKKQAGAWAAAELRRIRQNVKRESR